MLHRVKQLDEICSNYIWNMFKQSFKLEHQDCLCQPIFSESLRLVVKTFHAASVWYVTHTLCGELQSILTMLWVPVCELQICDLQIYPQWGGELCSSGSVALQLALRSPSPFPTVHWPSLWCVYCTPVVFTFFSLVLHSEMFKRLARCCVW